MPAAGIRVTTAKIADSAHNDGVERSTETYRAVPAAGYRIKTAETVIQHTGEEKMFISDSIAKLIEEMLENSDGILELRRNDLADQLGCVPSQINYVITSRFTPEKGYLTESRRGGGGYIRIEKVRLNGNEYLMHFFFSIGPKLEKKASLAMIRNLFDKGMLTEREFNICSGVMSGITNDSQRADIMRQIIMALLK